jgi:hypothetical protein
MVFREKSRMELPVRAVTVRAGTSIFWHHHVLSRDSEFLGVKLVRSMMNDRLLFADSLAAPRDSKVCAVNDAQAASLSRRRNPLVSGLSHAASIEISTSRGGALITEFLHIVAHVNHTRVSCLRQAAFVIPVPQDVLIIGGATRELEFRFELPSESDFVSKARPEICDTR